MTLYTPQAAFDEHGALIVPPGSHCECAVHKLFCAHLLEVWLFIAALQKLVIMAANPPAEQITVHYLRARFPEYVAEVWPLEDSALHPLTCHIAPDLPGMAGQHALEAQVLSRWSCGSVSPGDRIISNPWRRGAVRFQPARTKGLHAFGEGEREGGREGEVERV